MACKDCLLTEEIYPELTWDGGLVWQCPSCGCIQCEFYAPRDFKFITEAKFEKMMDGNEVSKSAPRGKFVYETDIEVIAINNPNGEREYEEFPDLVECLEWLSGKRSV